MHSIDRGNAPNYAAASRVTSTPRIISQMMQGDRLPSFGGEHREITAIFTDIAGFTTTAETLDAATIAGAARQIFRGARQMQWWRYGGLVNDFIGDGLVVLFGCTYCTSRTMLSAP